MKAFTPSVGMEEIKDDLLAIIQAHGPLRAKQIVHFLEEQGWEEVYPFTINPILHGQLKNKTVATGRVVQNESYEWYVEEHTTLPTNNTWTPANNQAKIPATSSTSVGDLNLALEAAIPEAPGSANFSLVFKQSRKLSTSALSSVFYRFDWGKISPGLLKRLDISVLKEDNGSTSLAAMNEAIWKALTRSQSTTQAGWSDPALSPELLEQARIRLEQEGLITLKVVEPIQFLPKHNFFRSEKNIIIHGNLPPIKTHFTDSQAAELCSRLASGWARSLAKKFSGASDPNPARTRYELHAIAMKALGIYGTHLLSFVVTLDRLDFRNAAAVETRSYKDVRPDFPLFSFQRQVGERLNIGFFLRKKTGAHRKLEYSADVRVLSAEYIPLGSVDELGRLRLKLENFRPLLSVFFAPEGPGYRMFSGVSSGVCVLCNRPLSHPDSLRMGIGPVCAQTSGFDAALYGGSIEN